MRRRTVLLGTGVTLSAIIAGCADDAASGDDDETDAEDDTDTDDTTGEGNGADDDDETGDTDDENGDDGDEDESEADEALEETEPPMEGLAIIEHEFDEDDYTTTVGGVVANNTGEDLRNVEVRVVFYDADGEQVDESSTTAPELADEEEWEFEIITVEADISEYAIAITDATTVERSAP